jgi:hypothetical protein
MTKHQSDGYRKSGLKKFPSLCEDEAKPDYLILWTAEDASSVVGSSNGGNGSVTTVQREKVRYYVVAGDMRDSQSFVCIPIICSRNSLLLEHSRSCSLQSID